MVFFEAPHRLAAMLADAVATFGPTRPAALCRELTKTYEEVRRVSLGELAAWAGETEVRGEITLVVAGASGPAAVDEGSLADEVAAAESDGMTRRDAIALVAARHRLPKREVYQAVIRHRGPRSADSDPGRQDSAAHGSAAPGSAAYDSVGHREEGQCEPDRPGEAQRG